MFVLPGTITVFYHEPIPFDSGEKNLTELLTFHELMNWHPQAIEIDAIG
jgi:hypothetical protein